MFDFVFQGHKFLNIYLLLQKRYATMVTRITIKPTTPPIPAPIPVNNSAYIKTSLWFSIHRTEKRRLNVLFNVQVNRFTFNYQV